MFKWNWISKLGHFKKNEEWHPSRIVVSNHPSNSKFERIYIKQPNKKLGNDIKGAFGYTILKLYKNCNAIELQYYCLDCM